MNLYFYKLRKIKSGDWEMRRTGKKWHVHLGRGLFKQIWRCLFFRIKTAKLNIIF